MVFFWTGGIVILHDPVADSLVGSHIIGYVVPVGAIDSQVSPPASVDCSGSRLYSDSLYLLLHCQWSGVFPTWGWTFICAKNFDQIRVTVHTLFVWCLCWRRRLEPMTHICRRLHYISLGLLLYSLGAHDIKMIWYLFLTHACHPLFWFLCARAQLINVLLPLSRLNAD